MKNRKKWKSKKWKWDSFRRVNRPSQFWARNQNASSVSHVTNVVNDLDEILIHEGTVQCSKQILLDRNTDQINYKPTKKAGIMKRVRQRQEARAPTLIGFLPRIVLPMFFTAFSTIGLAHGFVPMEVRASSRATKLPNTALAASGVFDNIPVTTETDADFGFATAPSALTSSEIWALRIGSGILTYFGFVFATDRPKGQLGVPLVDENNNSMDGCLKVSQSTVPGAGLGLFAARSMPKGTVLGTYPGVVLPLGQHSASAKVRDCPGCASYIWRFTDNQYVIDPTDHGDGTLTALCKGGNPSQPLSVAFFNILSALGLFRGVSTALCRINEPPKGSDVNVVTEEDLETRTVTFSLERDVYAGEELHIDYGLTYDRSGYAM